MLASPTTVVLPPVVDLDSMDAVRDRLLEAIDAGGASIDGSTVERIATNALLMLLSAAETAERHAGSLALVSPSAPMWMAIERLGLAPAFSGLVREAH